MEFKKLKGLQCLDKSREEDPNKDDPVIQNGLSTLSVTLFEA